MGRVHRLEEAVANQIAAGEVVERPASVVKELIENALDAGATRIEVDIEGGGVELLRVQDDGLGMSKEDAVLALERHATSKLKTAEDLVHVSTLGFRGEALPSIASISRFELSTREQSSDEGTLVEVLGGKLGAVRAVGMPVGTRVQVSDLFFNVPARRKFLKRPETEVSHIVDAVERLALAHTGVSVRLRSAGRTLLDVPRSTLGERLARLERILGSELAAELVALPESRPSAPVKVSGFVARPARSERSMRRLYTFVNGRFVRDRTIQHAIQNVYRGHLPSGRFPVAVLHLEVDPALVDVNVHPQKTEVRFSDTSVVHRVVSGSVHAALAAELPLTGFGAGLDSSASSQAREAFTAFGGAASPSSLILGRAMNAGLEAPFRAQAPLSSVSRGGGSIPSSSPSLGSQSRVLACLGGRGLVVERPEGGFAYVDVERAEAALLTVRLEAELEARGRVDAAPLLIPSRFEHAPGPEGLFEAKQATLERLGFEVEPFGGRTFVLKTAPRALGAIEPVHLVDFVRTFLDAPGSAAPDQRDLLARIANLVRPFIEDLTQAEALVHRLGRAFGERPPPICFRVEWSPEELRRLLESA